MCCFSLGRRLTRMLLIPALIYLMISLFVAKTDAHPELSLEFIEESLSLAPDAKNNNIISGIVTIHNRGAQVNDVNFNAVLNQYN